MLLKRIISFFLGLPIACFIHLNASAASFSQSYFLDASGRLTVNDVAQQPFKHYQDNLHLGFIDGSVWIKISIGEKAHPAPIKNIPKEHVLILSPFVLENITVYEPTQGSWQVQNGGSLLASPSNVCPYGMHCFILKTEEIQPAEHIFIKIQHTGYLTLKSEITPISALATITSIYTESITFSQSIALSLFVVSLVLILIDRSMFIVVYSVMQLGIFLYIVFASGKMYVFFPFLQAENFSHLNYQFVNLRIFLIILLGYSFTKNYGANPTYKHFVFTLLCACVFASALIGFGYLRQGIYVYVAAIALNLPVQFYGLRRSINIPLNIKWLLGGAYLVFTTVVIYGYINIFTGSDMLNDRRAEFIFFTNYRINGLAFGVVVFLVLIFKYYDEKIKSILREKDLQLNVETSRISGEKLKERQTLIDILTHELKNPLATLRFATYSLNQKIATDSESQSRTHRINATIDRMDHLITQVANSNKVDRFQTEHPATHINAKALVTQIIEDLLPSNESLDNRFFLELPENMDFYGNPQMLFLIIDNLISNALKYAEPQSLIRVLVAQDQHASVLTISNHFPVNARPDPDKLFQRYYRHDAFQPLAGMGIGLSLIKDAADKIGADISFTLDDKFITFTLRMPLCQQA